MRRSTSATSRTTTWPTTSTASTYPAISRRTNCSPPLPLRPHLPAPPLCRSTPPTMVDAQSTSQWPPRICSASCATPNASRCAIRYGAFNPSRCCPVHCCSASNDRARRWCCGNRRPRTFEPSRSRRWRSRAFDIIWMRTQIGQERTAAQTSISWTRASRMTLDWTTITARRSIWTARWTWICRCGLAVVRSGWFRGLALQSSLNQWGLNLFYR